MIELRITLGQHARPQRAANGARPTTSNLRPARMDGLHVDVLAALIATLPDAAPPTNFAEAGTAALGGFLRNVWANLPETDDVKG